MSIRNSLSMPEEEVQALIDAGNQYVVRFKIEFAVSARCLAALGVVPFEGEHGEAEAVAVEVMGIDELIAKFSFDHCSRSGAKFAFDDTNDGSDARSSAKAVMIAGISALQRFFTALGSYSVGAAKKKRCST